MMMIHKTEPGFESKFIIIIMFFIVFHSLSFISKCGSKLLSVVSEELYQMWTASVCCTKSWVTA